MPSSRFVEQKNALKDFLERVPLYERAPVQDVHSARQLVATAELLEARNDADAAACYATAAMLLSGYYTECHISRLEVPRWPQVLNRSHEPLFDARDYRAAQSYLQKTA